MERLVKTHFNEEQQEEIQALCHDLGAQISTRITIILPSGKVLADSEENPNTMDNHGDRPEIRQAIKEGIGKSIRYSYTLGQNMMYVAITSVEDGHILGVIRTSKAIPVLTHFLNKKYLELFLIFLMIGSIGAVLSFFMAHKLSKPLRELETGVEYFAKGDFSYHIYIPKSVEFGKLANTMNEMARQLDERIYTITRQHNEIEAVLSSMEEAVIAVDTEERIIRFNQSAAILFEVEPLSVKGKNIQEVVRNPYILKFVKETLFSGDSIKFDIEFHNHEQKILQAHGSLLRDSNENVIGALIVLYNITQLKKLENMRRDFVANVSHELKTPITSIKGFVETLKDGALDDREFANQFLDIILRHTDRLNAIIEDLLNLSRIEQEAERSQIELEKGKIKNIIEAAVNLCKKKAMEKDIDIQFQCENQLIAKINPPLLELAIVNLIDNAIKYSGNGKSILIDAKKVYDEVVISVKDHGCGIPKEHLSRIFERFYRVDKARSRDLGGTGLGLAIVKHIVAAHFGSVSAQSVEQQGSTFYIYLPSIN